MLVRQQTALHVLAFVLIGSAVVPATAFTVATFSDPYREGDPPIFVVVGDTLSGGWSGVGLTLLTPFDGSSYLNATFTMTKVNILDPNGMTGPGIIQFRDSGNELILQIDFTTAKLTQPFGFGGSDFTSDNVTFSGPKIPPNLVDEHFSFSFANPRDYQGGKGYSAAFTSSATPEPTGIALLLLGLPFVLRRH